MVKIAAAVLIGLAVSAPLHAVAQFRYKDDEGITHFVNSMGIKCRSNIGRERSAVQCRRPSQPGSTGNARRARTSGSGTRGSLMRSVWRPVGASPALKRLPPGRAASSREVTSDEN